MIRKPTSDLTIRPKMSRSLIMTLTVVGFFVFFACLYLAYGQGIRAGHVRFAEDQALIEQMRSTLDEHRTQTTEAQQSLAFAQRQLQIQEEAYRQISKAYANSEQKNSVLGSRLDFYRSIISPEDGQSGPAIQDLDYTYADGRLSFDITLVQAIKHKHQVRGNLKITLYQNDTALAQWPVSSTRSVSYQYFQQVSGFIEQSELSAAAKLKVELSLQDGETLERWFDVASPAVEAINTNEVSPTS
ncbi:DUF6776 family protein [Arenicella xantha]|uniref:Uncharacterized protein n=1 Tax=Arenicella xantha TaxID=644221 RepID=A0A395JMW5_9GAMM|nr:DUF6776 family protein [Arenicella xantha]RBP52633.1 hypothetical protein DFR28_10113 [Arenicella xantha]